MSLENGAGLFSRPRYSHLLGLLGWNSSSLIMLSEKKSFYSAVIRGFELLIKALKAFYIDQNHRHFDPHVGDTACQIRAAMIYVEFFRIPREPAEVRTRIGEIESFITRLKALQGSMGFQAKSEEPGHDDVVRRISSKNEPASNFLARIFAGFSVRLDEFTLFLAYLLAMPRTFGEPSASGWRVTHLSFKEIERLGFSRQKAKKLLLEAQRFLSSFSVLWLLGTSIPGTPKREAAGLQALVLEDSLRRQQLPCLLTFKFIFDRLLPYPDLPLIVMAVMKTKRVYLRSRRFSSEAATFEETDASQLSGRAAFYMEGDSKCESAQDLKERLSGDGLLRLMYIAAFLHPQYAGCQYDRALLERQLFLLFGQSGLLAKIFSECKGQLGSAELYPSSDVFTPRHLYFGTEATSARTL